MTYLRKTFTRIPIFVCFTWYGLQYRPGHGLFRRVCCGWNTLIHIEKQSQISNWAHWSRLTCQFLECIGNTLLMPKCTQKTFEHFPKMKSAPGMSVYMCLYMYVYSGALRSEQLRRAIFIHRCHTACIRFAAQRPGWCEPWADRVNANGEVEHIDSKFFCRS